MMPLGFQSVWLMIASCMLWVVTSPTPDARIIVVVEIGACCCLILRVVDFGVRLYRMCVAVVDDDDVGKDEREIRQLDVRTPSIDRNREVESSKRRRYPAPRREFINLLSDDPDLSKVLDYAASEWKDDFRDRIYMALFYMDRLYHDGLEHRRDQWARKLMTALMIVSVLLRDRHMTQSMRCRAAEVFQMSMDDFRDMEYRMEDYLYPDFEIDSMKLEKFTSTFGGQIECLWSSRWSK